MTRKEIALLNHKKGYNCAQSVVCAFCDKLDIKEDDLFRLSEAFGFGMGHGNVCGAVTAMVMIAGLEKSFGIDSALRLEQLLVLTSQFSLKLRKIP